MSKENVTLLARNLNPVANPFLFLAVGVGYDRVLWYYGLKWAYIDCSLRRLIRRPEHLIGRHQYLPVN
jgi:hypothetical protein